METKIQGEPLINSLNPAMSPADFVKRVEESLTKEDEKVLGSGYKDQMVQAILYTAVFAPYPATFGTNALAGVVDDFGASDLEKTINSDIDLEHTDKLINRTQHLVGRLMGFGVIEMDKEGKLFVKQEVVDKLMPILGRFEE